MTVYEYDPKASGPLLVPEEWTQLGHELAVQEDEQTYEEERVTAAVYDEQVEEALEPVIRRDPPGMSRAELDALSQYIAAEHQLQGISVRQAIARGSRQLRKKHDIKRIVD